MSPLISSGNEDGADEFVDVDFVGVGVLVDVGVLVGIGVFVGVAVAEGVFGEPPEPITSALAISG